MQNVRVSMIRHDLDGIPQFGLPSGYSIRWHRRGDREVWVRIHERAERYLPISSQLYDDQFGSDEFELSLRQAFLLDAQGREIGTATAWFDENYHGLRFGRVHWVAIEPEHQGKGLAKPLLTIICNHLVELGHDRVYFSTGTARVAAIHLYLSYGFELEINNGEERELWDQVLEKLKRRNKP